MLMRILNVLVLVAAAAPFCLFLLQFRSLKGFESTAAVLRWMATIVILLVTGPLLVNLMSLDEPLSTSGIEQIWSMATRLFAAVGGWFLLVTWRKRRRIPVSTMRRRHDDLKQQGE